MTSKAKSCSVLQFITVLMFACFIQSATASQLPPISGANYDGEQISWDALAGADGYNIYLEFQYLDTVIGSTSYVPGARGEYRIVGFDNEGNFSPLQVIDAGVVPTTNIAQVDLLPGEEDLDLPIVNADQLPPVTGANFDGIVLSWDTLAGAIGYNLYLDFSYVDTVVGSTTYMPTVSGEYRIAAFDADGRFSPLQVISADVVRTTNIAVVNLLDEPSVRQPTSPQNVSLIIYSNTAAELFWDRPLTSENVVMTEVFRNDVLLGTSAGNSFFDDTRIPGTTYRYDLVAINADDQRSSPAVVNPGAFDGVREEAVFNLVAGISDVTGDNPHARRFSMLRGLTSDSNTLVLSSTERVVNDRGILVNRNSYLCDAGSPGTLVIDEIESRFGIHNLDFENCSIDGSSYDGSLSIVGTDIGGYNATYRELFIGEGDDNTFISGEVSLNIGRAINFMSLTYTNFQYSVIGNLLDEAGLDTAVTLNQTVSDSLVSETRSTFETSFTVSAPWTQGETVEVFTVDQFTGADIGNGNYVSGTLIVQSASGEFVDIFANTGNAATWGADIVTFEIEDDGRVNGNWSDTGSLPCLSVTTGVNALEGCVSR